MKLTTCFITKNQNNTVYKYNRKRSRFQRPFFYRKSALTTLLNSNIPPNFWHENF